MKKAYLLLCLLLPACLAFAQKNEAVIKGKLADTVYLESMAEASISLLNATDSSLVTYALADKNGEFEIKNLKAGMYRLLISFQGYQPYSKPLTLETGLLDLGTLYLEKVTTLLDEVFVERPPITIKKDTVEFSAGAFKTKPNATAEDLLKKLPGIEVDKDGNIKAQGEDIQKVYVNGKEFFGNDPKLATKNLTADMIESVQVYDDMSDQAKFTRIDDGSRAKTINLKIKKDRDNGYFGRVMAGMGDDGRYDASLSINKFKGDQRISLIGASNNLSQQGFSFSDVVGAMGGFGSGGGGGMAISLGGGGGMIMATGMRGGAMGRMGGFGGGFGGGGGGILKSNSIGINYADKWGTETDASGSYFFSNTNRTAEESRLQQSFFPNDSVSVESRDSRSVNLNQNHRFNFRTEFYIDSMNSLVYAPNLTFQHSESNNFDTSFTRASNGVLDYLAIAGKTQNTSVREGVTLRNDLLYRRRFNKVGRTFTLGFNNTINNSDGNGLNYAPLTFYNPDGSVANTLDQHLRTTQKTRGINNVLSTSYTEPIGSNKIIEVNYAYSNNHTTSDRKALDYNGSTGKFDQVNPDQTNYIENDYITNRVGANFRMQKEKFSYQLGGSLQSSSLSNHSIEASTGKDTTYKQRFVNFSPTANFSYNVGKQKSIRFNYQGRPNAPSIQQLQEVPDVTNPLQIVTGNRGLSQEFTNMLSLNYHSFDWVNYNMLMIGLNFSNTLNKIVNSIDTIAQGIQLIRPENADGVYNTGAYVSLGVPLKGSLKGSQLNFSSDASYNRNLSLLYKQKIPTDNWMFSQTAGINLAMKEKLFIGLNGSFTYNSTRYSGESSGVEDQRYFTQNYSTDISYTFLKNYILSTDFNYYINTGRSDGYNQSIPLWNAGIARQMFKKKNGEIRFSVNDLLNQNQNINRSAVDNYITDTRSNGQRRYFMIRFTYNLMRMGKSNAPARPMPSNMRVRMNNGRIGF